MSCYINVTPSVFEATPLAQPHTRSLASWLLTTITSVLESNHTESSLDEPDQFNNDFNLALSAPAMFHLLPRWLTSPKGAICIQDI
ncbi:unnamed protein product [Rhizoctonia solani]|uniref:Uncharacterized protein n=1 Tax=Rhizoctonia solani TaxID=456999 RepID=A0A8H3DU10_9AGAM|nr:unnamed protein product [Rhizoctonia solani]